MSRQTHAVVRALGKKEIEIVTIEEIKELRFQKKVTFTLGRKYHILDWKRNGQDDILTWTPAEIYAMGSKSDMLQELDRPERFRSTKFPDSELNDMSLTNDDLEESMSSTSDSCINELDNRQSDDEEVVVTPKQKAQRLERKQQLKKKQFNLSMLDQKYAILKEGNLSGQASTQVNCTTYMENLEPVETASLSTSCLLEEAQHEEQVNLECPIQPNPQSEQQSSLIVERLAMLEQREMEMRKREEYVAKKFQELKKIDYPTVQRELFFTDINNNAASTQQNRVQDDGLYSHKVKRRLGYHDDTNEGRDFRNLVPEGKKESHGSRKVFELFMEVDDEGEEVEMVHIGCSVNIQREQWKYAKRKSFSASVFCKNLARSIYGTAGLRRRCLRLSEKLLTVPEKFDDIHTPPRQLMTPQKKRAIELCLKYWLLRYKPHLIKFTIEGEVDKVGHYITEEINYQIKEKRKLNRKDAEQAAKAATETPVSEGSGDEEHES